MSGNSIGSSQGRVYPEDVYAVKPDTYPPKVIDTIAGYVQRTWHLLTPPDITFVRHMIVHPDGGLKRFLDSRRTNQETNKVPDTTERHSQRIRELIDRALRNVKAEQERSLPKYQGPVPIRSIEFRGGNEPTTTRAWLAEGALMLSAAGDNIEEAIAALVGTIGADLTEDPASSRESLETFLREGVGRGMSSKELAYLMVQFFNDNALIPHGQYVSMNFDTIGKKRRSHEFDIHQIDIFQTPFRPLGMLTISDASKDAAPCRSPCYHGSNEVVEIPIAYLILELQAVLVHGTTDKLRRELGNDAGDYRDGKIERDHYKWIWDTFGSKELLRSMLPTVRNARINNIEKWKSLKDTPLCQALWSHIVVEEIRHGIDDQCLMALMHSMPEAYSESELPLANILLLKPEGRVRQKLLPEGVLNTLGEEELRMMSSAILEFIGKIVATAMGTSPQLEISHIRKTLQESRIRMQDRSHTFREELGNARLQDADKKTWGHAMAARMIAIFLGQHFNMIDHPFDLDSPFDQIELMKILARLQRMQPEELRKGIMNATKDEFVVPVDCDPFPRINAHGKFVLAI